MALYLHIWQWDVMSWEFICLSECILLYIQLRVKQICKKKKKRSCCFRAVKFLLPLMVSVSWRKYSAPLHNLPPNAPHTITLLGCLTCYQRGWGYGCSETKSLKIIKLWFYCIRCIFGWEERISNKKKLLDFWVLLYTQKSLRVVCPTMTHVTQKRLSVHMDRSLF